MKKVLEKIVPRFVFDAYHKIMPFVGALVYRFPTRKIEVIGVTGTNGKTTTVNMISEILKEAGYKTAFLSSIKFQIGEKEETNLLKMTMPGRMTIQKFLRDAVSDNCQYAIFEVSSEGIKQFRHLFINFKTAVITNLSPEHIESHGGFEKYKKAKGILFQSTKKNHIINLDDQNKNYFLDFTAEKKWGYGIDFQDSFDGKKVKAENCSAGREGVEFTVDKVNFKVPLLGYFNIYNSLAAISTGLSCGVNLETCQRALGKMNSIPGRMELVADEPLIVVDYAVTPDALEKLYQTIGEMFPDGEIIAVLGSCGGGRDKWKRPILGEIAGKYSKTAIITNEDPYDEDPEEIINSVARGVGSKAIKILDRREAIGKALSLARGEDIVVITGKGCEPWMCVAGGKKIKWDDREIAREELKKSFKN